MRGKRVAYWFVAVGALVSIGLLILYITKTTPLDVNSQIDHNIWSSYGTVFGGIVGALFSLAGIFLLISTLESQERSIENQEKASHKQLFESRFFALVTMHRENCKEMNVKKRTGRKVFLILQREFYQCKLIVDSLNEMTSKKLSEEDVINISYMCFFFGAVGEASTQILKEKLSAFPAYYESIIRMFKENQESIRNREDLAYAPFEGHQSRISHYIRHLFQTVKYVDEQPSHLFNYKEKYRYLKILRAQLSTQEQAFLFFNSLCDIGKPWERRADLDYNKKLITKYNFIKNIPAGYTIGIDVRRYYPDLRFEGDPLTARREKLEETYF